MIFDGRIPGNDGRVLRFRFSPRDAKVWPYVQGDYPGLDGQAGRFSAVPPRIERTRHPSARHPHWWIDDPDPAVAEGIHPGARTVSRWREVRDSADRLTRAGPAATGRTSAPANHRSR